MKVRVQVTHLTSAGDNDRFVLQEAVWVVLAEVGGNGSNASR